LRDGLTAKQVEMGSAVLVVPDTW